MGISRPVYRSRTLSGRFWYRRINHPGLDAVYDAELHRSGYLGYSDPDQHLVADFLPILAWSIGSGQQIELYAGLIEGVSGTGFDPGRLRAGSTPWVIGIAAAVGLFASVTLHELGHSWVALRYEIEIGSTTLWILGGIASLKSVPRGWNRERWTVVAGPITGVIVAGVRYIEVLVSPETLHVPRFLVGYLAITNVALAGFNLLPVFPMDGGAHLPGVAGTFTSVRHRDADCGPSGAPVSIGGVLNVQIILLLLALFTYGAATTESRTVLVDELLEGRTVGEITTREPATIDRKATSRGSVRNCSATDSPFILSPTTAEHRSGSFRLMTSGRRDDRIGGRPGRSDYARSPTGGIGCRCLRHPRPTGRYRWAERNRPAERGVRRGAFGSGLRTRDDGSAWIPKRIQRMRMCISC